MAETVQVPEGFAVGHWTDRDGWTGCPVVLAPDGATAGGEVRGGGPGTRESDLLSPATAARDVHAVLLTGGSAFGLAAADGVVRWLVDHDLGYRTLPGWVVPLVPAAVLFDLPLGEPAARPVRSWSEGASARAPVAPWARRWGPSTGRRAGSARRSSGWARRLCAR